MYKNIFYLFAETIKLIQPISFEPQQRGLVGIWILIFLNPAFNKDFFIKICDYLKWEKKELLNFFEEIKNENYYVNIIGLSKNNINLYFNKLNNFYSS